MRQIINLLTCLCFLIISPLAHALLNLELTQGMAGAVPIAVVPFEVDGVTPPQDVSGIIESDLATSGRFKVYGGNKIDHSASHLNEINFDYFRHLGTDNIVIGTIKPVGSNRYQLDVQLLDAYKGKVTRAEAIILSRKMVVSAHDLRAAAHHLSDLIYEQLTGIRGVFSTRLAYIVVQREGPDARYALEVSDFDGYNPRPLLNSKEPMMSPAWSPNGRQLAYVTFEHRHASIYIQDIATAKRHLVSEFEGINGAPAWSPDGKKLALVLSKDGSPNIYTIDLGTKKLTQITKDWSINTEPSWSPNGQSLIFTSNRSGGPQIYQKNLATGSVTRLTYEGNYNARASFTRDGNHIVVLNKQSNLYNIGVLDLNNGHLRVLTNAGVDNDSPSIAPNSSMVLYGTLYRGRNVLGMVATDGSVQLRMPARNGEVQDPAWSPFLS